MPSIRFSFLDYLSKQEFLDFAKRFAKINQKTDPDDNGLIFHQDKVAIGLGFKNWALLHKHVESASWSAWDTLREVALKKPGLGAFIEERAFRIIDEDDAVDSMRSWARSKYTPLIDFAFYDPESESGYSWPDVDMAEELSEEFAGRYPDDLIQRVGNELDADEGPWGLEKYD
ncbi:hypothetical protein [Variovorax sp. GB1P17]|uniref:hypothetical protein n=1 Tax=Variovorax sp. GB1P17 TaxID=3443740 RepID=UPI003F45534D